MLAKPLAELPHIALQPTPRVELLYIQWGRLRPENKVVCLAISRATSYSIATQPTPRVELPYIQWGRLRPENKVVSQAISRATHIALQPTPRVELLYIQWGGGAEI